VRPARFNLSTLKPMLKEVHSRLSRVVIECLNYAAFISRYDKPDTLFYIDPPYWGSEKDYGKEMFSRQSFEMMATQLASIGGRFIMSLGDLPEVREMFKAFDLAEVATTHTIAKVAGGKDRRRELLISNFALDPSTGV